MKIIYKKTQVSSLAKPTPHIGEKVFLTFYFSCDFCKKYDLGNRTLSIKTTHQKYMNR